MTMILKSTAALAMATIALFSFRSIEASGIKGSVTPAASAGTIWAIQGTDSVKTTATEGSFSFADVKPGTYQVVVEAQAPYKTLVKDAVEVKEGAVTDLGSLSLQQ